MEEVLELPLSEWRRIARNSQDPQLLDYLIQFSHLDERKKFILHPVNRVVHKRQAVELGSDEEHRLVVESMLTKW